jgi:V8-like Glu-specific endopeptidase
LLKPETPAEHLFFITARLECEKSGDRWEGTGFFVRVPIRDGDDQLILVTNRHVLIDEDLGPAETIRIITPTRSDDEPPVLVPDRQAIAVAHSPRIDSHQNPDIDVAVLGLNGLMMTDENNPFIKTIPIDMLFNDELISQRDAIEQVTFIGYPEGLYDTVNMTPIARRGWTATPMSLDYDGKPMFLIDASVFNGSSGSPVFLLNKGGYTNRQGGLVFDGPLIVLVGIVAAAYDKSVYGEFVFARSLPEITMDQALNLGVVYKTQTILETIDQFLSAKGYSRVPSPARAEDAKPEDAPNVPPYTETG